MSDSESDGISFFDASYFVDRAFEEDKRFVQEGMAKIKGEMEIALAFAKTEEQAKSLVREVLIRNKENGRNFSEPDIIWNEQGNQVFITAEVKTSIINSEKENSVISIIATQIVNLPRDITNSGDKKMVISDIIN